MYRTRIWPWPVGGINGIAPKAGAASRYDTSAWSTVFRSAYTFSVMRIAKDLLPCATRSFHFIGFISIAIEALIRGRINDKGLLPLRPRLD